MKSQKLININKASVVEKPRQKLRQYMKIYGSAYDPKRLLNKFALEMGEVRKKGLTEQFFLNHEKVAFALGLDTHSPASLSVQEEYRHFLVEMINRVEYEHDCKTAIEKSLAETIALSHIRIVSLTKRFNAYTVDDVTPTKEATDYYNLISKEIDRAHRQLNNAILTLKQVKTPRMPLNVTAKTAFIAQNQQFNNCDPCEINDRQ